MQFFRHFPLWSYWDLLSIRGNCSGTSLNRVPVSGWIVANPLNMGEPSVGVVWVVDVWKGGLQALQLQCSHCSPSSVVKQKGFESDVSAKVHWLWFIFPVVLFWFQKDRLVLLTNVYNLYTILYSIVVYTRVSYWNHAFLTDK